MKIALIILGILVAIVLLFGMSVIGTRNELVTQKNTVEGAFAQVDVALQRRADLIPNLVETVKGFASQEKDVIASVANARAALSGARTPAEKISANSQLDGALSRLLVVVDDPPSELATRTKRRKATARATTTAKSITTTTATRKTATMT